MIDSTRREVLEVLSELSELIPQIRFGQLIANLSYLAREPSNGAIWDMEDDELLAAAREHLEFWRTRNAAKVDPTPAMSAEKSQ